MKGGMNILFVCNPQEEEEEEILTNCGFANLSLYDMCIKKESVMYILEKHFLCTPNSYILHTNTPTYMYTIVWVESRKIFIEKTNPMANALQEKEAMREDGTKYG